MGLGSWYGVQNTSRESTLIQSNYHVDILDDCGKIDFWSFGIFAIFGYFYCILKGAPESLRKRLVAWKIQTNLSPRVLKIIYWVLVQKTSTVLFSKWIVLFRSDVYINQSLFVENGHFSKQPRILAKKCGTIFFD